MAGYMVVFGLGLGLILQVLTVAVQNAVPYEELGTATSGVTFFRMIGGSFGTAVFGAIFANLVVRNVLDALHVTKAPTGFSLNAENPSVIHKLPAGAAGRRDPGHRPHHPDHVPHRGAHRLRRLPAQLDAARRSSCASPSGPRSRPRSSGSPSPAPRSVRSSGSSSGRPAARTARELYGMLAGPGRARPRSPGPVGCSTGWPTGPTRTVEEVGDRLKVDPVRLADGVDSLASRRG